MFVWTATRSADSRRAPPLRLSVSALTSPSIDATRSSRIDVACATAATCVRACSMASSRVRAASRAASSRAFVALWRAWLSMSAAAVSAA